MSLEILHVAFMLFGCIARLERTKITSFSCLRIDLFGV